MHLLPPVLGYIEPFSPHKANNEGDGLPLRSLASAA
jgi:hypothetical protein